jgi:hypothetical protein
MRRFEIAALLAIGALAGCMTGAPRPQAETRPVVAAVADAGSNGGAGAGGSAIAAPLVLDRTDLSIGTTVEFRHLPTVSEMQDASEQFALRHVVISLPAWPQGNADLSRFASLPPEADVIVILPGYPPDRTTLDAWNALRGSIRMVLMVDGPPDSPYVFDGLNLQRHLERVVARMARPSRAGFERLQRPLSFVVTAAE